MNAFYQKRWLLILFAGLYSSTMMGQTTRAIKDSIDILLSSWESKQVPGISIAVVKEEASWVAVRTDMALQQYYRIHAHKEPNKAIIKVAHKLLSRMRAVINSGIPYQVGLVK